MSIFNWGAKQEQSVPENTTPDVKEADFIDVNDPNETETQVRLIDYGTGHPIELIYTYIDEDLEEQGRSDANKNSELEYMNTKVEIIKQGLSRLFDIALLKYNDNIRLVEAKKKSLNQFGLLSGIERCNATIETYNEHIKKINELQRAFENEDASMMSMVQSYKRGFAAGVSDNTLQLIDKSK